MADNPKNSTAPKPTRRQFLTASGGIAAAGAAAAGVSLETGHETEAEEPKDPRRLNYRETDHIRAYYARSRF